MLKIKLCSDLQSSKCSEFRQRIIKYLPQCKMLYNTETTTVLPQYIRKSETIECGYCLLDTLTLGLKPAEAFIPSTVKL